MRPVRLRSLVAGIILAAGCSLTAQLGALADSMDAYLHAAALPPTCPTSASDAPVCTVNLPSPTTSNYRATTDESIVFRIGWADTTRVPCQDYLENTTVTITVDGQAVGYSTLSCRFLAKPADGLPASLARQWFTDDRYLSAPLSPGLHTASAEVDFNGDVPYQAGCPDPAGCVVPAGTVFLFNKTVTVT